MHCWGFDPSDANRHDAIRIGTLPIVERIRAALSEHVCFGDVDRTRLIPNGNGLGLSAQCVMRGPIGVPTSDATPDASTR